MGQSSGATRPRSIAAILAAACVAAGVASCGQSKASHETVSLLPTTAGKAASWEWSAACRYGPKASSGCDAAGPLIGTAQLAGNEWNLGGTQPSGEAVTMSVNSSGALKVGANLSSASHCTATTCITREANTWVRGFPSVLYGIDQCHAKTSPVQSPKLHLPAKVDSIPADLVGSTTYDAQGAEVTYDVAYDMWLSASDTKTPCQSDGTLEVMVWTDYNAKALLPDSLKVGTANIPFAVNGAFKSGDQAWSVYVNNVYGQGHTVPWGGTVWLVLNDANKTSRGTVKVDLSAALTTVGTLLEHNYGWTSFASSYWLDTIAFGMEFGPADADPYGSGPTKFSLDLSKYCLQVGSTAADATC
jgi:hypothetical protein